MFKDGLRLKGWAWLWSSQTETIFLTPFAHYFALFFLNVSSAWIIMDLCFLFFIWVMFQFCNTIFKYSLECCVLLVFFSTLAMEHCHPTNEIQVLAWWTVSQMISPQPVVSKFHILKINIYSLTLIVCGYFYLKSSNWVSARNETRNTV